MRVLLVNEFFPPDLAPTGVLLRDLAMELVTRGHDVTVLCSAASYAASGSVDRDLPQRLRVLRLGRSGAIRKGMRQTFQRQLEFHSRAFRAAWRMTPKPEVVVAMTTPPLIGLTMQAATARTVRHMQWLMDIYPDVLAAHGMFRTDSVVFRMLAAMVRRQHRRSTLVVTLSPGMATATRASLAGGESPPVTVIPLWAPEGLAPWPRGEPNPIREQRGWGAEETVFLYSGNMGLGHTVQPFLQAALASQNTPGLRWAFSGAGPGEQKVRSFARMHPAARVECFGYVEERDLAAHLASADVHLVSLRSTWSRLLFPSKLPAAFAVGRPVLFVGPPDSDPAVWIREAGAGWVVGEGDAEGLSRAVVECSDMHERRKRGDAALLLARRQFARAVNCGKLADMVEDAGRNSRCLEPRKAESV